MMNEFCNNNHPSLAIKEMEMEMVVVLPEDLIISEIVLRVPPVSVVRFKSVCKSWYSLISNPCFLRNHACQFHLLQRFRRLDPPGVLLSPEFITIECSVYAILPQNQDHDQDEDEKVVKLFLDQSLPAFKQKFPDCFLIDSCNGLLLYRTELAPNRYTIFNPITNQYKEVPLMDLLHTFFKPNTMVIYDNPHIVFDPSKSSSYKILTILGGNHSTHYEFYVYSSDSGLWKLLNTGYTVIEECSIGGKTFMFDGVFYWLCIRDSFCFDVVNESVWLLPQPPLRAEYRDTEVHYFGECGGRLRLLVEYFDYFGDDGSTFPCSFDIMEMEQGSTIWTVKSRVILEAGFDHLIQQTSDPFYPDVVKVMHVYETVKGEEAVLLNVGYKRIVSFNITTNTFGNELTIPYFKRLDWLSAFPFTPTLFPLLM